MSRRPALAAVLAAIAALPGAAHGGDRRGPIESREEWLLVQPLLNLPACSPDPLPAGRTEVRLDGDWGNDFSWEAGPGGRAVDLRYLVDGEHRTAALSVRRGMGDRWSIGLRAPVHWRGGGFLDGIIDPFHRVFGFPDNGRPLFPEDRLRVEGRRGGDALLWTGVGGTGLGSLEAEVRVALRLPADGRGWSAGVVGRATLPTGGGPFANAGTGAGAQVVAAHTLGRIADAYVGLGATLSSKSEREGLRYRRHRAHGFAALEVRPVRWWSLLVQGDVAGRIVEDVERLPGTHGYLRIGSKVGLGRSWTLEGGFTEGIVDLSSTTDFGIFAGVVRRF
jgi:hypothetical protein